MYSFHPRIIPVLLLKGEGLVKGLKFKNHRYIGDPINTIKIFNQKEVDELILFDIDATINNNSPNLNKLKEISGECFMPLAFGGGIDSIELIREILALGVEKVILNSGAVKNIGLVKQAIKYFGSSTITCSIDYKSNLFGKKYVFIKSGMEKTKLDPFEWAKTLEKIGVGELIINSIDKDGTKEGYDYKYFKLFIDKINIPLVISGGAKGKTDFTNCIKNGYNSMAGGACFVFQGRHDAVLITYEK